MSKQINRSWGDCIFQWMPLGLGVTATLLMALMVYGLLVLQPEGGRVDNVFATLEGLAFLALIGLPLVAGTISFLVPRINKKFSFKQTYKFINNDYTK